MFPFDLAGRRVDGPQGGKLVFPLDELPAPARYTYAQLDGRRGLQRLPHGARLVRRHKEQTAGWIERGRLEVGATVIVRHALFRAADVVQHNRPTIRADLPRPVRIDERFADQEPARLTVNGVEEAVPIGDHDHFSRLTAN